MPIKAVNYLIENFQKGSTFKNFLSEINNKDIKVKVSGLKGSSLSLLISSCAICCEQNIQFIILPDKERAAYIYNDIENLLNDSIKPFHQKQVLFFPTTYLRPYQIEEVDNTNVLQRIEVMKRISSSKVEKTIIVSYSEAIVEKVINENAFKSSVLKIAINSAISFDNIIDYLTNNEFERVDFVIEPGQYSVRGGIIDVFSFSNDSPYRIVFFGDNIEHIKSFNPIDQISIDELDHIAITSNVQKRSINEDRISIIKYIPKDSILWIDNFNFIIDKIECEFSKAEAAFNKKNSIFQHLTPNQLYSNKELIINDLKKHSTVEISTNSLLNATKSFNFNTALQPSFNKNFDLLMKFLIENTSNNIENIILSENPKQQERLRAIITDIMFNNNFKSNELKYSFSNISLHEGFTNNETYTSYLTDHQIFERYHKYRLRDSYKSKEALIIQSITELKSGDFVTHIDHGIGRFAGLETIENNGKLQEAARIIYKNDDILYISIHSLYKLSKYSGKDGAEPTLNKLGSNTWTKLKGKTKSRVKDIARELIKLYAERKTTSGYAYSPDTYLQHELEASFIYEDTPDQLKATLDVKEDMEKSYPMDRLICGDVGFGKTEIAIRAAFKAVADGKQVAILVPTTILALQHYNSFSERLKDFPCTIEYISRFKTYKEQKEITNKLSKGEINILIGTHRLVSKDIIFDDLGLLIIDEEQKFGVAMKEKLKQLKVNVDTLTLTATPIPRTLQFSLMGARDLSIINTPPPNRYPVQTELHVFNEEIIRDALFYELSRGGQVFFVNNMISNISEIAGIINRIAPDAKVAIVHGQLDGTKLEKIMVDFTEGLYDVLVTTKIIESGLDIPNVNTIIVNQAQNFGLSELHQLRGRVGRTNKKAFCYLLAPPVIALSDDARKRLKAVEDFSEIGSGFNLAMRDLDIRGAGDILGAEQSGFISEIGFEMYHKILDEAIYELKQSEFSDVYNNESLFVNDCVIDTDLQIMFPSEYISNSSERLKLYKELNNIRNETELDTFRNKLIDRFGNLPKEANELLNTIFIRQLAMNLGIEKITLRNNTMKATFISDKKSRFFDSNIFNNILQYVISNQNTLSMKETNEKLNLYFKNINSIHIAINTLRPLSDFAFNNA